MGVHKDALKYLPVYFSECCTLLPGYKGLFVKIYGYHKLFWTVCIYLNVKGSVIKDEVVPRGVCIQSNVTSVGHILNHLIEAGIK